MFGKSKSKRKITFPNVIKGAKNAWKIEDLRKKLLFTAAMLLFYRIGCNLPVPYVDATMLESLFSGESVLSYLNMVGGGALASCALFALGVGPYINASIIVQLLCVVIPSWESMQKEGGQEGKDKLNRIQKVLAIFFSFTMSLGYYFILKKSEALKYTEGFEAFFSAVVIIALLITGSQLVVWLGEQIDIKGIGNGVSLLIFIGIVSDWARIYSTFATINLYATVFGNKWWYAAYPLVVLFIIISVLFVIYVDAAERTIPIQYSAKGGARHRLASGSSHLPVRVMMTGVLPVIFANSICSVPATIAMFIDSKSKAYEYLSAFNSNSWLYCVILAVLIIAFNYFYTAIQYDPLQISNDLRKNGGVISGIRPGQPTVEYLEGQFKRVSRLGAIALVFIALSPIVVGNLSNIPMQFGGTSLMILVSVTLETEKSIESYMTSRYHKGFLDA